MVDDCVLPPPCASELPTHPKSPGKGSPHRTPDRTREPEQLPFPQNNPKLSFEQLEDNQAG